MKIKGKKQLQQIKATAQKIQKLARDAKKVEKIVNAPMASLGSFAGKRLGHEKIGRGAGKFLGKILGTGDYHVRSNSLATGSQTIGSDTVPQFVETGRGLRVVHREYLGDVTTDAAGNFKIDTYPINPGLFQTFPWLSVIAAQYDEWKPNGIVACFKSTASTYSGTAALGTVIMATDYDPGDPAYQNKIEMENSEFAVSTNVATSLIHPLECAEGERATRVLYTRQGAVTDDKRFYDLGNLYVATVGAAPSTNVGELWLSYDITFYKTQLYGGILGRTIQGALYRWTAADNTNPFGTSRTPDNNNSFELSFASPSTNFDFPFSMNRGTFLVTCIWEGNNVACDCGVTYTVPGAAPGSGIVGVGIIGATVYRTNTTTNKFVLQFTVFCNAPTSLTPQRITLNSVALPTGSGAGYMVVTQINPLLSW